MTSALVCLGWRDSWDVGLSVPKLGKPWANRDELTNCTGGQCGIRAAKEKGTLQEEKGMMHMEIESPGFTP